MVKEVFEAKSFAVIGAAREEDKVGHVIFKNLITQGVKAFPINPNADCILGEKCYKSLLDINEKIDCVIIAIPAKIVLQILKECGKKKIKNLSPGVSNFSHRCVS